MAYHFELGDSSDKIVYSGSAALASTGFTVAFWAFPESVPGNTYFARIFNGSSTTSTLLWYSSSNVFSAQFNGTSHAKRFAASGSIPAGAWIHVCVTFTGVVTAGVNIHVYTDGTEVSYGSTSNGSGSWVTPANEMEVGNRNSDNARPYDGSMADLATWNRILTAGEITALAAGLSPLAIGSSLTSHKPFVTNAADIVTGDIGTITGAVTTVDDHPPIYMPGSPIVMAAVAAAPAAGVSRLMLLGVGS